jgi:hypothetical protein
MHCERRQIARRRTEEKRVEASFPLRATTTAVDPERDARAAHKNGRVIAADALAMTRP